MSSAGWQAPRCKCGHVQGDHRSSHSRSLTAAAIRSLGGSCTIAGCSCEHFTDAASARSKKQASQNAQNEEAA